jgi:hypothetical protein
LADPAAAQEGVELTALTLTVIPYQGRLSDPSTGDAVTDGNYTMTFRLYDVATGGSALWTETKDVAVQGGVFSTALGDSAALSHNLFNGQALWLGVKVGTDEEATPRQQILPVAYALSLVPGAVIRSSGSTTGLRVTTTGSGDALQVSGPTSLDGNLSVTGSLSGGSHNHSGADIASGTVAEARIHTSIARDNEIIPTVLGNDGPGSALDADLLDGQQASAFAGATHSHSGGDITSGTVAEARIPAAIARDNEIMPLVLAKDGAGSTLDSDLLDGKQATDFAPRSHTHPSLPIAYAFINSNGSKASGTANVSSTWVSAYQRYEITITDYSYYWTDYVTVVTTVGTCGPAVAATGSFGGRLTVDIIDTGGNNKQCYFQFVTFKP